jgi:uncharacterized membrane protein YebE (DUF533 family)
LKELEMKLDTQELREVAATEAPRVNLYQASTRRCVH